MKRLHVHVAVENLDASIQFYSHLFAAEPTVRKDDYAKWMLEDPRVNFAISTRRHGARAYVTLAFRSRTGSNWPMSTAACSAQMDQCSNREPPMLLREEREGWISDPQGVKWETFLTTGESTTYGCDIVGAPPSTCCAPKAA